MVDTDPSVISSKLNDQVHAQSNSAFEGFRLFRVANPTILGGRVTMERLVPVLPK